MTVQQSSSGSKFSALSAKTLFFAAAAGVVGALLQFFLQIQSAEHRTYTGINQLIDTLEKPAARSVLILDAELADDIADGLTAHDFVLEASIFEDHSVILGESKSQNEPRPYSGLESLIAPFVGTVANISKPLPLPESMSEASGEIKVKVDRARAVAGHLDGMPRTILITFLIVTAIVLMGAAFSAPRRD